MTLIPDPWGPVNADANAQSRGISWTAFPALVHAQNKFLRSPSNTRSVHLPDQLIDLVLAVA